MDLEKTKVDELVSKEQLWILAIALEPDVPRFGPGLFNKVKTYGDQTTVVHKIRDKLHDELVLHLVVRANDLRSAVEEFWEACMILPDIPLAQFFPKHPQDPFLQENEYASTEHLPYVRPEVNTGFRDWYYYNTFVGYGTIMEHENELKRVGNGELFEAEIQVFAVSREDSKTYIACLRLPDENQRLRVGRSVQIRWQGANMKSVIDENNETTEEGEHVQEPITREELEIMDRWTGVVIEPLPAARKDTISLIIRRPSEETPGARQPKLVSNLKNPPFENVMVRIPLSNKIFKRFLACNHDLQHWSKGEVARELLGGDLMDLPHVNLLQGVDKDLIQATTTRGRVNFDIKNIIEGLPNGRGRFFTITGPAGSGKSYVMCVLSLLILKGSNFLYPVHPDGATGSWMPNFQNYKKGSRDAEDEPEKKEHKPQVVISCPTNFLTNANCVTMQQAADSLFAGEPIMIIRVHPLELELLIADQSYTCHEQNSRVAESDDDRQVEEDMNEEGLIKILRGVLEHYKKSLPSVTSPTPGINDSRLQLMEHSLGYRMLQVCGIIPGSPWEAPGKYRNFVAHHADRLNEKNTLVEVPELLFNKSMKRLARDTLARADIVFGTPFVLGTSLIYHSLHPAVVFIDEAGMTPESDLLPMLTYYFPKAFGLFGDPKQLGPTIISSKEENPFSGQISVPLLSRMIINGCQGFKLQHQHRLLGAIHHFTNRLFYDSRTRWQKSKNLDPEGWHSKIKTFNFQKYRVKENMVFLNIPDSKEMAVGYSWANRANVLTGLDIVYDLVSGYSILPADIVILVGYDAQKREYLSEISRRVARIPQVKWLDVRIHVIETFQGKEAPFAIFDFVRTETMGHMRSFRRLNVGMTRGRFGLWCLYNANSMMNYVDRKSWILREMQNLVKDCRMGATLKLPEMD